MSIDRRCRERHLPEGRPRHAPVGSPSGLPPSRFLRALGTGPSRSPCHGGPAPRTRGPGVPIAIPPEDAGPRLQGCPLSAGRRRCIFTCVGRGCAPRAGPCLGPLPFPGGVPQGAGTVPAAHEGAYEPAPVACAGDHGGLPALLAPGILGGCALGEDQVPGRGGRGARHLVSLLHSKPHEAGPPARGDPGGNHGGHLGGGGDEGGRSLRPLSPRPRCARGGGFLSAVRRAGDHRRRVLADRWWQKASAAGLRRLPARPDVPGRLGQRFRSPRDPGALGGPAAEAPGPALRHGGGSGGRACPPACDAGTGGPHR